MCNHHGSDMLAGHYTAVCRNPTDGQWYSFDDVHTKQISEAEVVTKVSKTFALAIHSKHLVRVRC